MNKPSAASSSHFQYAASGSIKIMPTFTVKGLCYTRIACLMSHSIGEDKGQRRIKNGKCK